MFLAGVLLGLVVGALWALAPILVWVGYVSFRDRRRCREDSRAKPVRIISSAVAPRSAQERASRRRHPAGRDIRRPAGR